MKTFPYYPYYLWQLYFVITGFNMSAISEHLDEMKLRIEKIKSTVGSLGLWSSSVLDTVKNRKIVKEKIEMLKEIWEDLDDVIGAY